MVCSEKYNTWEARIKIISWPVHAVVSMCARCCHPIPIKHLSQIYMRREQTTWLFKEWHYYKYESLLCIN